MIIGYARVSTDDQSTAAQLPELRKAGCEQIFEESLSGRDLQRPELERCLSRLRKGDTLVVWRLDRLGRSIRDLLNIVDRLSAGKIAFVSLKDKFDTSTASGRLIFHVFAALSEYERNLNSERTLLGLKAARARGRVGGRKKSLSVQQIRVVKTMWESEKFSKQEIGDQFGVSVSTIDRIVRPERIGVHKGEAAKLSKALPPLKPVTPLKSVSSKTSARAKKSVVPRKAGK
jgi:DNA invertase Pin-like site-specific DNA recombinase